MSAPLLTSPAWSEVLDGRLGASGIRELVFDPMPHGLGDLLDQCLPGQYRPRTELLRTKYQPGRKLTAYYRLHVGATVHLIALSWAAQPHPNAQGDNSLDGEDRRQLTAPFRRLSARSDDGRVSLVIAPLDPVMPQLTRLVDPAYVTGMLRRLSNECAAAAEMTSIEAVRYRPGQRHVLRAEAGSDPGRAAFIKIDRDDSGERALQFANAVGARLVDECPTVDLVAPLGYSVPDRAAIWRGVAGRLLSREVADPARGAQLLALLGRGIRVLHDLPYDATSGLTAAHAPPPQPARAELTATLRAGAPLTALAPAVGERYRRLAEETVDRLANLGDEQPRLAHGDLKCDNIVVAGDRIWLLDLDRAGLADPAMDLSKLFADLRWWGHHHGVDGEPLIQAFLHGYGPADPIRLARARLTAVLFQLKLTARRVPVHSADWATQVTRRVEEAQTLLSTRPTP